MDSVSRGSLLLKYRPAPEMPAAWSRHKSSMFTKERKGFRANTTNVSPACLLTQGQRKRRMAEAITERGAQQGPSPPAANRSAASTAAGLLLRAAPRKAAGVTARELTLLLLGLLALLAVEMAVVPPRGGC